MSQEPLAQVMRTHQQAIVAGHEPLLAHQAILSVLRAVDKGETTRGKAVLLLTYMAQVAETPAYAHLYRQAAAEVRQMQRGEQEHDGHA